MHCGPGDRVVVIGSGVAGLVTALCLAPLPVLLVTEGKLGACGSSAWAQGGIAAALGPDDGPELHAKDTIAAGAGLCDTAVALSVAAEAVSSIDMLRRWGVTFDQTASGELTLTLEAAHSRRRILHAGGDGTGAALIRVLSERIRTSCTIEVAERTRAVDLLAEAGRVFGAVLYQDGVLRRVAARAVVLATGGIGGLYASTTNPASSWGSGLVLAAQAGAEVRDLELVQFHPTAIAVAPAGRRDAPLPLASEAIRGEGGVLVDDTGALVMSGVSGGDLAPRDCVARAIWERMQAGRRVFLDAREAIGPRFPRRFPTITALCRTAGIDPVSQPIPVRPAAHYHMGGIATNGRGRTTLPGLWAVGEVASTGLHGANRLASNSLIEAVVFGRRAAADIGNRAIPHRIPRSHDGCTGLQVGVHETSTTLAAFAELRRRMDAGVGVVRDRDGLQSAITWLRTLRDGCTHVEPLRRRAEVALTIAVAALNRTESRGAHARRDFPEADTRWARHQAIKLDIGPAATKPFAGAHLEHRRPWQKPRKPFPLS